MSHATWVERFRKEYYTIRSQQKACFVFINDGISYIVLNDDCDYSSAFVAGLKTGGADRHTD